MTLDRLIVHQIIRLDAAGGGSQLIQSDQCIVNNDRAVHFVTELNNRYKNIKQSQGNFLTDNNPFYNEFHGYHQESNDRIFVQFTQQVMPDLQAAMDGTAAKGGYIVFADYQEFGRHIGVFLIRNRQGSTLEKGNRDTTFAINDTEHIDFEHLAMACRINIDRFISAAASHLTFINTRGADSEFFKDWIGVGPLVNNREDTQSLYRILRMIPPPIGEGDMPMESSVFLNRVYNDIKNAPRGAEVDLQDIGRRYYDDENRLTQYAEENGLSLNHVFKPDSTILRKFVNIKVKADNIDLTFPQSFLEENRVELQEEEGRIIIHSRELLDAIRSEFGNNNGAEPNT